MKRLLKLILSIPFGLMFLQASASAENFTLEVQYPENRPFKAYVVNQQDASIYLETNGDVHHSFVAGQYSLIALFRDSVHVIEDIEINRHRIISVNSSDARDELAISVITNEQGENVPFYSYDSTFLLQLSLPKTQFYVDLDEHYQSLRGGFPVMFSRLSGQAELRFAGALTPEMSEASPSIAFYTFSQKFDRHNPVSPFAIDARESFVERLTFGAQKVLQSRATISLGHRQWPIPGYVSPTARNIKRGGEASVQQSNGFSVDFTEPVAISVYGTARPDTNNCAIGLFSLSARGRSLANGRYSFDIMSDFAFNAEGQIALYPYYNRFCQEGYTRTLETGDGIEIDDNTQFVSMQTRVVNALHPSYNSIPQYEQFLDVNVYAQGPYGALSFGTEQRELLLGCNNIANSVWPISQPRYEGATCPDYRMTSAYTHRLADWDFNVTLDAILMSAPADYGVSFSPTLNIEALVLRQNGQRVSVATEPGAIITFPVWADTPVTEFNAQIKVEGDWQPLALISEDAPEALYKEYSAVLPDVYFGRLAHLRLSGESEGGARTELYIEGAFRIGQDQNATFSADSDNDRIPDYKDDDSDNDGVPDLEDAFVYDTDNDGVINERDEDDDNDGLEDNLDRGPQDPNDTRRVPVVEGDMDGDNIADLVVRNAPGLISFIKYSWDGSIGRIPGGESEDIPVAGDFDGDRVGDVAFYRPSRFTWIIQRSSDGEIEEVRFGDFAEDIPLVADYDGDGLSDLAIRRPSEQTFYVRYSSTGEVVSTRFGLQSTDIPLTGDFDGDGKADFAVRRPSNFHFYVRNSSDGAIQRIRFGLQETDIPLTGDFDGDGKTDVAVRRPSNFHFYIRNSSDSSISRVRFGLQAADIPVISDYDGDGKADVAVRRPANFHWYILRSSDGEIERHRFGTQAHYVPLLAPFKSRASLTESAGR